MHLLYLRIVVKHKDMNKRILVGSFLENYSETQRMVDIAEELLGLGYRIFYIGKGKYDFLLEGHNFERILIDEDEEWYTKERCKKMNEYCRYGNQYTNYEDLDRIVQAELRVIDECKPDFMLTGYRLSFTFSARIAGVPLGWCFGTVTSLPYLMKVRDSLQKMDKKNLSRDQKITYISESIAVKLFLGSRKDDVFNRYLTDHGCEPYDYMIELFSGDLLLMSDPRELFPDIKEDQRHIFTGPIFNYRNMGSGDGCDVITSKDKPKIMFSLGSAASREQYLGVLKELRELDYEFYAPTLGVVSENDIRGYPDNFHFAYAFPINEIMAKCDACVMKGGLGTLYSAMLNAVPFVSITNDYEQHQNIGNLLRQYNCGIHLYDGTFAKGAIGKAIGKVLSEPSYRSETRRLSEIISTYYHTDRDGAKTAAAAIDRYIRENRSL